MITAAEAKALAAAAKYNLANAEVAAALEDFYKVIRERASQGHNSVYIQRVINMEVDSALIALLREKGFEAAIALGTDENEDGIVIRW